MISRALHLDRVTAAESAALGAAVEGLLRYFQRQTPIRGGSLLITIFGDSIAPRGGAVSLGSLIDLARPFGLAERLVRTSVARLARDGWLVARRNGRRSEYRLAASGQQRFAEATRRIYGEIPRSWDGEWTLLVLPPAAGGRHQKVRDELRWLGFGQVSPGVFAHPSWSLQEARAGLNGLEGVSQGLLFKSSSEGSDADRHLVASGWDLEDLAGRYRKFVETFTPVADAIVPAACAAVPTACAAVPTANAAAPAANTTAPAANTTVPTANASAPVSGATAPGALGAYASTSVLSAEAAFIIRTLLIHEYRKIHLQDPLLPPALLPADWVGARAYELSKRLYSAVFELAEDYLSAKAGTMTESLPAASAATYERFGGIACKGQTND